MFAYDEGWSRRINEAIDSGLTAEAAIERVQQRMRARMREIDDPLLQERMHDLEDLSNRLLRIVSGRMGTAAQTGLTHDTVLIARNLGPAELLEYDRRRLKAVLLEEGSLTSHMTIVARAIGVPVIGRLNDIRHSVEDGETILVDGDNGSIIIRPNRPLQASFEHRMTLSKRRSAEFAATKALPAVTLDGLKVSVMVNAGLAEDASALAMTGADGIGLFRTEFQFLVSATLPGRERQHRLYTKVLESAGKRPGRVPHRRHRRRQGPALSHRRPRRSRESGDGLARAAAFARALDLDEGAGAGADRGVGRQGAAGDVPDDLRAVGI